MNTAIQKQITATLPILLLGLNILVFGTFAVFGENRGEFLVSYFDALRFYYLPGLLVFVVLGWLTLSLSKRTSVLLNAITILLGVLFYIHGNLLLWDTGILDGTPLDLSETWRGIVDALLWLTLAWAAFHYRNWLAVQGWKICALLILFQSIGMLAILYEKQGQSTPNLTTFPKQLEMLSRDINVIHIVLDGFQASIFEELLSEHPKLADHFSGFTFFRDATTSSDVTYLSVPATLSGKAFRNQQAISEYHEETLHGYNLYSFLASHDFKVDVATPLWWNKSNSLFSSYYRIPRPYADEQETLLSSALLLGDISLYRQLPYFLKPLIYRSGAWLLSASLVSKPEQQFEHFAHNEFVADLENRMSVTATEPRYKFIHLVTPHAPFVSSSECTFTGAALEYSTQAFTQQSLCTLESITSLLDRLKILGVYENSMLIIHGDHGGGVAFDMVMENGDRTTSSKALYRMWGNPLPLILIKPPGAAGDLEISNQQVQLLDVPVTVARQLGFSSEFPGTPMFDESPETDVERVYFNSKIHRNKAAAKDYFDEFTGYRITGSVYNVSSWQEAESYEAPLTNDSGSYRWGSRISFGTGGNFRPLQTGGWIITAAKDVTWTEGNRAGLAINFPEIDSSLEQSTINMRVRIKPLLAPGKLDQQRVFIFVGTEKVGEWLVSTNKFHDIELTFAAGILNQAGKSDISFELPDAQSPRSLGTGKDNRKLAIAFYSIQFELVSGIDKPGFDTQVQ